MQTRKSVKEVKTGVMLKFKRILLKYYTPVNYYLASVIKYLA